MKNKAHAYYFAFISTIQVFFGQSESVAAATIEHKLIPEMGCDIFVSGDIIAGDADALRAALMSSDQEISKALDYSSMNEPMVGMRPRERSRVCFNSNGGSFLEGLKIAELLIEYRKGSAVGNNMVCESACALAFMGGSTAISQIESSDDTDRVLHPRGLLGFHAPSLVVPSGQYDERTVAQAYGVALAALQALSETRNTVFRGYVPGTDQATSFRYRFPESLLLEMLGTPPSEMRYVRTVGEASRWDIRIAPIRFPEIGTPYARFAAACDSVASYYSESAEFAFETPPFIAAQSGRLAAFEVQAASDVSPSGGIGQPSPWRGAQGDNGIRLIAVMGEYWYECDFELLSYREALFDQLVPVGLVSFEGRRYIYPHHLFNPSTELVEMALPHGEAFDINRIFTSLSAELVELLSASTLSCWLTSPNARVTNVSEYVNLRRQSDFSAPVIRQVSLGERVRTLRADNITVIGQERDRQSCISACQAFGNNQADRAARDRAQQCINDNMLWYEITDARGNRGWVSRKFLQELE